MEPKPILYAYDDYRLFLSDWLRHKRGAAKGFSARLFAKKAGFGAHDIFQLIASGRRNLSIKSIPKFARALALTADESAFFESLVLMNQSSNVVERLQYYDRILSHPARHRFAPMEQAQLAFFRSWLSPVIYEMTQFADFKPDAHWIAERFDPPPAVSEVKKALAAVLESGLLVKKNGKWKPAKTDVDTGDGVRNLHLYAYHEHALEKAADALLLPISKRYVQVTTVAAPAAALGELRALAQKFEIEALQLIRKHNGPLNEVFQVSLQLFPTIRTIEPEAKRKKP